MLLEELPDGAAVAAAQTEVQLGLQRVGGLREGDRAQTAQDLRFARLEEVLRLHAALAVRQNEDVRGRRVRDDAVPNVSTGEEDAEKKNRTCMSGVSLWGMECLVKPPLGVAIRTLFTLGLRTITPRPRLSAFTKKGSIVPMN